jgi:hypothetical protein
VTSDVTAGVDGVDGGTDGLGAGARDRYARGAGGWYGLAGGRMNGFASGGGGTNGLAGGCRNGLDEAAAELDEELVAAA